MSCLKGVSLPNHHFRYPYGLEFVLLNWGKRLSTTWPLPLALRSMVLTTTFSSAFNIKVPCALKIYLGVSENSGTPKSPILIGFSIINHPFWGTPIFGNTHLWNTWSCTAIVNDSTIPYLLTQDPGWAEVKRSMGISHERVKWSPCKPVVWGLIHGCSERGEHPWYQCYHLYPISSY